MRFGVAASDISNTTIMASIALAMMVSGNCSIG